MRITIATSTPLARFDQETETVTALTATLVMANNVYNVSKTKESKFKEYGMKFVAGMV